VEAELLQAPLEIPVHLGDEHELGVPGDRRRPELLVGHRVGTPVPGAGEHLVEEQHGHVAADRVAVPADRRQRLAHGVLGSPTAVVELGGVVPGHRGAVVAVVDVARLAAPAILALEGHRSVGVVVVVVLDVDPDALVGRQVRSVVGVRRIWWIRARHEPVGMLHDPARIDAHVVGHHVTGQPDATRPGPIAQVAVGLLAAQVLRDLVVHQRVGRGDRVRVAHELLDAL
jgi:hypothetical protein